MLGFTEKVMVLESHPIFRLVAKITAQFEAMLRGKQAAAGKQVVQELRADMNVGGELGLGQTMVIQKVTQHGSSAVGERNPEGRVGFHEVNGNR